MSSKSRKRTALFTTIAVLLVGAAIVAYLGTKAVLRHRTMEWKQEGMAASLAGDHEKAADLLGRYLRRVPFDNDALRSYVISREQAEMPNGQHLADTIGALKFLLRDQPDNLDDRRHLLELYVKIDRRPEAMDIANAILAKFPYDIRTLDLKTEIHARLGQYREALQTTERWSGAAPLNIAPHLTRLALRHRIGQPTSDIINDAKILRDTHPDDARFELIQGAAYIEANERKPAEQWLTTAAKHTSPKDDFAEALIGQFDRAGMNDQSMTLLQDWAKQEGGAAFRPLLARRLWENGRWQEVAAALGDLDAANPKTDPTLIALKAIALTNLKKLPEAGACITPLAGRNQPVARAWSTLLRGFADPAAMDDRQFIRDCESALFNEPRNAYLHYFLGDAQLRLGETDLAIEIWRRAAATNLTWCMPATRLADLSLTRGHLQEAMDLATLAVRRGSSNLAATLAFARAWAANLDGGQVGKPEDLLKLLAEIQRQIPGEDRTLILQIQLMAQKGDKNEALRIAREAAARTPQPDEAFFVHLAAITRTLDPALAEECFTRSEKAHGVTAALAYARALQEAMSARPAEGVKAFDALAQRAGKAADLRWRLARAQYLDLVVDPGAKDAWIALGDAYPKDLTVQQAAVSALATRGEREFLLRTIDRLKVLAGDRALVWRLAKARLQVQSGRETDYVEGSKLLNDIIQAYPLLPEPRVLLAQALIRMNRVDGAIDQLAIAANLDPSSVSTAFQLAGLLQGRGDLERANKEMDRITPFLCSPQDRHQAALLLAQQGDQKRAIELLEESQKEAGAGRPDLFLAVLYGQRNQLDKAEAVLRKLLEKPDLPTIQFAVMLFSYQRRTADAEKVLGLLDSLKLEPGRKEIAWGNYFQTVKNLPEAVKRYRQATQIAPANPATWQALALCQTVMGDLTAALATVDESLRAAPDNKAMTVVKQNAALLQTAAAEESLRPLVLSIIRDPVGGTVALELLRTVVDGHRLGEMEHLAAQLQQLIERNPAYLPAHVQAAQCSWAMGRSSEALTILQRAMAASPSDPEPARLTVTLCAAAGRWEDMLNAAQAWKTREPASFAPQLAMAEARLGLRQYEETIKQIQPYLTAAKAEPDKYIDLLSLYCRALAAAGQADAAEAIIWPAAGKSAQWRMVWMQVAAGFLANPQASAWLQRIVPIIPASASDEQAMLANAWETLGQRLNDPQANRNAAAVFARITQDPAASSSLLVSAGQQSERGGDQPTAETLYRRALAKDPNQLIALNNLACMISARGGEMKEAVALVQSAVKLSPRQAAVHDTLALVQSKAGDPASAAQSMKLAINLEPDTAKWRVRLAQYLLDANQLAEAGKAIGELDNRRLNLDKLTPELHTQLEAIRKRLRPGGATAVTPPK